MSDFDMTLPFFYHKRGYEKRVEMAVDYLKATYDIIHESNQTLMGALDETYIEALFETLQNLVTQQVQQIDGEPSDDVVETLTKRYQSLDWSKVDAETFRKAFQMSFLQVDRYDQLPANYQMTPEAIALLMGYFAVKVSQTSTQSDTLSVFDPAFGTGNLWNIVQNELLKNGRRVEGFGYDNDELLLDIADQSLQLMGLAPQLFHGDSLQNLYISPMDLIVSDLPVGYYPIQQNLNDFKTAFTDNEKSLPYTHYLMIEQSLRYLKPGKWGLFLVPADLTNDQHFVDLIKGINHYGYFQAFLELPENLFRHQSGRKAILMVQKAENQAKQAEPVLAGEIPDLKAIEQMSQFIDSFDRWLTDITKE